MTTTVDDTHSISAGDDADGDDLPDGVSSFSGLSLRICKLQSLLETESIAAP